MTPPNAREENARSKGVTTEQRTMTKQGTTTGSAWRSVGRFRFWVAGGSLLLQSLVGCNGGVQHPPHGHPNDKAYCANRAPTENNCMACSSQPGCGWCDRPQEGESACQPGIHAEAPATCLGGWALSTEDCSPPPPPPSATAVRAAPGAI